MIPQPGNDGGLENGHPLGKAFTLWWTILNPRFIVISFARALGDRRAIGTGYLAVAAVSLRHLLRLSPIYARNNPAWQR